MQTHDIQELASVQTAPTRMRAVAADLSLAADLLEQGVAEDNRDKRRQAAEILSPIAAGFTAFVLAGAIEGAALEQLTNGSDGPVH